jgi:hypothetical protein
MGGNDVARGKVFLQGMTKTQVTEAIREELKQYAFNQEFESSLISELIAQKHYHCAAQRIRPTRFRKLYRPNSPYDFEGYFQAHGWRKVSWTQCITPRSDRDWLKRALRDAAHPIVSTYRSRHPTCERCQSSPSVEVDHVYPEFEQMVSQIIHSLSAEQVTEALLSFDWLSDAPFAFPTDHPALTLLQETHRHATLQAVCKPCHQANAGERR